MDKYERMGHMREVSDDEHSLDTTRPTYYIPHHGIWKDADGTRKLRVVFNASRESPTGVSLNKLLHCGPALQNDLLTIIMRWRFHRVAFCTDIEMMYRQILVDPRDVDLQRIVWKKPQSQQLTRYRLLTVTYGMSCAPYLAIRTLRQLAADEEIRFPIAAQILTQDSYVDDILSGADSLTTARERRDQLIGLLKAGGFHLRKWVANVDSLVHDLPEQDRLRPQWHDFQSDSPVKTLGVSWDPVDDEFRFKAPGERGPRCPTKRQVLATIARLYDPVGWLGPVIITAKILMQDLWRNKLDWDERLPLELARQWAAFEDSLPAVTAIRIPRWLNTTSSSEFELHGFADASANAYAAAVYIKSNSPNKKSLCHLLTAKTRVSPVKVITIPRLELCAAVLLTHLLDRVSHDLPGAHTEIHAWTDSRIVLAWIQSDPSRWSDFVAHRVAEIQGTLPKAQWHHVATQENPADIASRGTDPATLEKHPLWWHGPPWLALDPSFWPVTSTTDSVTEITLQQEAVKKEQRKLACHLVGVEKDIISRFSSLTHLQRVIARCLRVREAFRRARTAASPLPIYLTPAEMETAYLRCVAQVQQRSFEKELSAIQRNGKLPNNSSLTKLNVFLDESGILRVGGRLQEATLPYAETHPVILPGDCHLSHLIIDWAHRSAMHGGALLTYSYILRRAWIIGGKSRARQHIRKCVRCVQSRARTCNQRMGNLPAERVTRARPFSRVGLDYAGPINVKTTKTGRRSTKGYLAIFVCLCTKAVHIEVVSDLTTAAFLAAMRRFAGRRGTPREIWSDNATTFRGADNELRATLRRAEVQWDLVAGALANDGITWKFIPPSAPHFGGLWEAAVKSAKGHMKRVLGRQILTFEELNTFVIQVEMCMNARPLSPLSGDLEDLEALTASHLLIGSALPMIPESVDPDQQLDRLQHWRLIQAMRDQFWVRWAREYLNTMQQRQKWTRRTANLKPNDLVLIVDPSLLSKGRWPMGRVLEVYPGPDGLVRTAKIRTAFGTYDRPIVKLCLLPVAQDEATHDPGPLVQA